MNRALIVSALAVLLLSGCASSQKMELIARWPYGASSAIASDGDIAYIGSGGVLAKVEYGDEAKLLKEVFTAGKVAKIVVDGDRVFVSCGKAGLVALDSDLNILAERNDFGGSQGVMANDHFVATRGKDGKILTFDRDTLAPMGEIPAGGQSKFRDLIGDTLVFCPLPETINKDTRLAELIVVKLDPKGAVLSQEMIVAPEGSWRVISSSDKETLYAVRQIQAWDRKGPKDQPLGEFYLEAFSIEGDTPEALRTYGPYEGTPNQIGVRDGLLYAATELALHIYDLENPAKTWRRVYKTGIGQLSVSESRVFAGPRKMSPNGVRSVEINDNDEIVETALFTHPCNSEGFFISNDLLYVAWNREGLRIIDISDPDNLHELSWLDMPNDGNLAEDIWVTGTEVYMADGTGLAIIDASDPRNPKVDSYFKDTSGSMANWIEGVRREGDYLYVAAHSRLRIFDVSDPKNAKEISELKVRVAKDLAVRDGLCHIAEWTGYTIVDVSDPFNPKELSYMHFGDKGKVKGVDVELKDNYAFVSCSGQGVHIIDFSDPENPEIVATAADGKNSIQGVEILGDYLYVATVYDRGVLKWDISDIRNPVLVDTFDTPGAALNVKIRDGILAVADFTCGAILLKP